MLLEQMFFRRFGVRFPQQLLSPRISSIDFLEFPKLAAYHFTEVDNVAVGPRVDEFFFRNITKKIPIRHITQLSSSVGNPRRLSLPLDPIIRAFHTKNRRFRWLRHSDQYPNDENQLVVINHALCSNNYKYIRSPFSDYNRWLNINSTIFHQLGKVAKDSGRHQYAIFKLPRQLPSVPRLNTFVNKQSQQMLSTFSDPGSAFILELWKWLDPATRSFSTLNYADPSQYSKINIIFEESGQWMLLNLGLLDEWIYTKDRPDAAATVATESFYEDLVIRDNSDWSKLEHSNAALEGFGFEDFSPQQKVKIIPEQIRKRILRMLMTLMEARTVEGAGSAPIVVDVEGAAADTPLVTPGAPEMDDQSLEDGKTTAEQKLDILDQDLMQLEVLEKEAEIEESAAAVKTNEAQSVIVNDEPIKVSDFDVQKDSHSIVKDTCDKLFQEGLLTGGEHRQMMKLNDAAIDLDSPIPGVKMKDYIHVTEEELKVKETIFPDKVTVLDKEQLKSTLKNFDATYIEKTLRKETVAMALATQKAGFVISDYKVEEHKDILGTQEMHSFRVHPVIGKSSTIYFKVPKIDPSGEFMVGGNVYRMRKQRTDLPIVKIAHDRVQLSSYYGKVFVSRSDKRVNDYGQWLVSSITNANKDEESSVSSVKPGSVFHNLDKTPFIYSSIAREIREITNREFTMHFDTKVCKTMYGEEMMNKYSSQGRMLFGDNQKGIFLLLDDNGTLYTTDGKKDPEVLSTFEEFFGLDSFKAPIPYAEVRVFGQGIPLGLMLGYYYGLEKLLTMLKVSPRRVLVGQRVNLQPHEWSIDFADETLVFSKEDQLATLILAGFNDFAKSLRNYSVYKFDVKGVYLTVLDQKKITTRFVREFDLLDDVFVDTNTESLLKQMNEPLTFRGLIVRSAELLMVDYHPNPLDLDYQIIRGYERVAGAIYSEMMFSIREQRRSLGRSTTQINMNPLAVWKRITADPSVKIVEDINPINNLKEMEAVTFSGVGGRSSRTMNAASRVFENRDKGVISEGTSDSSDVAINTSLVPNPSFVSVRGNTRFKPDENLSGTTLMSTSACLAVGSDTDDPKRINFISIQNSHTVACEGYMTLPVRTGYEQVIAHRNGEGYATEAEEDGVVESITEEGGIVRYKSGKTKGFLLGRRFGSSGGQTIPHEMATMLKTGDKFKAGQILAYNSGWFEPDYLNPGYVLFKAGVLATVALVETPDVHEDACTITEELARKLKTKLTKKKKIRLNFKDAVSDIQAIGSNVTFDTPLVLIQDELTANIGAFSEDTIATLASLSQQAPNAKYYGKIEKIEVFYNGAKEDMSPSIRALANYGDKLLAKAAKASDQEVFTGKVDESYRVDGEPLLLDTMCVVFSITDDVTAGIADKVVFANQMKSIISRVADYEIVTESGIKVDAFFGAYSIFKRIVNSAFDIGTTTVLMELGAKRAIEMYRGK